MKGRAAVPGVARIDAGGRALLLDVRVNPRARRVALRLPADFGPPRLTLPSARHLLHGMDFARSRADWLLARLDERAAAARPFVPGAVLPVDGRPLLLVRGAGRTVRAVGDRLEVGDSGDDLLFARRTERWLRGTAHALLTAETLALAGRHGLRVAGVRVGDQRSRWGSCTADGRIAYSWRLLLAPPSVRAAVVAHEVAHLVHRNHGPGFWALAERLLEHFQNDCLPSFGSINATQQHQSVFTESENALGVSHRAARAWLAAHGPALHGWGVRSEG